jgi:RNA polymerase sigma-70 factor, ECF subfamily
VLVPSYLSRLSTTDARMASHDRDLARRLRAGDDSAFEEFFAEYFPRVYRFARVRLTGDADAAEEVAQATLIRALAKIGTYRGEAALFVWLCSFCRHEISVWFERSGKAIHVSLSDDSAETRAILDAIATLSGDDPEHEYERRELSRVVHVTLDHLPRRYKEALVGKYLEGASVEEIGCRLDLGYKAAESLLTRARQAFREGFAAMSSRQFSTNDPS